MKYSVVIPTYNNCDQYLKPCLDSIFRWSKMADIELIISANGCYDNTYWYLQSLKNQFDSLGFSNHFKVVWNDKPLGYAKATNEGIKASTCDKIVLLNNDTVLLEQCKGQWLDMMNSAFADPVVGISAPVVQRCEAANSDFAVFFCAMISRRVFETIGLLNEDYGVGSGEDVEFCIEANRAGFLVAEATPKYYNGDIYTGGFPIFHAGEGTVHNPELVQNWNDTFHRNELRLAKKYNPEYYRWLLTNNFERAVFLKGDLVFVREYARYDWAAKYHIGKNIFELGCTTGYGIQFFPQDIKYIGLDYDPIIVDVAKEQDWGYDATFVNADINKYDLGQYDTIIAFEVIEHLDNGLEIVEKLKRHCKRLLITVPMNEPVGFWGEHHRLHGLNESHFPGFKFNYIDENGHITDVPRPVDEKNRLNLMICWWDNV